MKSIKTYALTVVPPASQSFARWDDRLEPWGPTHSWAHELLGIKWANAGGDWLDADGTPQGPKPFASLAIIAPLVDGQILRWTGPGMVALVKRLILRNAGILLKTAGQQLPYLWSREADPKYPRPTLSIQTSSGSFDLEAIADTWLTNNPDSYVGDPKSVIGLDYIRLPAAVRFDMSSVTGDILDVAMEITSSYPNSETGYSMDVFYLNMPELIIAPAAVYPDRIEHGIARGPDIMSDLDLANHPSVLYYTDFSSQDEAFIWAQWQDNTGWEINNNIYPDGTGGAMTFSELRKYGLWAGRLPASTHHNSISTAARLVSPENLNPYNAKFHRKLGNGFDELYFRYLLLVEDNAPEFMVVGIKMPGLGGAYQFSYATGANPIPSTSRWDGRMGMSMMSKANRASHMILHYYGADHTIHNQGARGFRFNLFPFSLKSDRWYCLEQRVKLNTPDGEGGWNADGIFEIWVDGVKAFSINDRLTRNIANCQICEVPFFNIYSGGAGPGTIPLGPIGFRFSAITCATEYIGMPKEVA